MMSSQRDLETTLDNYKGKDSFFDEIYSNYCSLFEFKCTYLLNVAERIVICLLLVWTVHVDTDFWPAIGRP